ncbi:hypothetical protein HG263_05560 [Pseudoalteromonas sp. JBTF-M23]|uniref:Uncharacterized protein n=1 Tax=Pseudoalteromonas caenipelagi TaxID=2726988 RepID=A0A849VBP9_9GAMM|nr:hypothetical protein [Pseudoalteromonas caenipelagi]NOU50003.1 hypothetical protein [Pseudoalteromonas caenipelagi]
MKLEIYINGQWKTIENHMPSDTPEYQIEAFIKENWQVNGNAPQFRTLLSEIEVTRARQEAFKKVTDGQGLDLLELIASRLVADPTFSDIAEPLQSWLDAKAEIRAQYPKIST